VSPAEPEGAGRGQPARHETRRDNAANFAGGCYRSGATGLMCPPKVPSMLSAVDDPILKRFRAALDQIYGDRIERVVLFGSRARGDAHDDSDYDIAIFLKDLTDRWQELDRLADLRSDILDETEAFIDAKPYRAGAYRERTSLMHEIRRDGIDL
jgi:predicted nucleotidyltransferase